MDTHTHFLRDDTKLYEFRTHAEAVGKAGWNKQIGENRKHRRPEVQQLLQEMYLDSDTKVALISNAAS